MHFTANRMCCPGGWITVARHPQSGGSHGWWWSVGLWTDRSRNDVLIFSL